MNSEKRFLAFDLGAESGRAVVGILKDDRLTLSEIHRFLTGGTKVNSHFHWDILAFYSQLVEGLKLYVSRYGSELEGIGVDTWGVDFGLLDRNGALIGYPYHYRDFRTDGTDKIIDNMLGNKELYKLTGIQLLPFNTINQLVAMAEKNDPALSSAESILFIGDLLHYFITGRKTTEFTIASISQLYNNVTGQWERKIFDVLEIPDRISTEIIRAGEIIGTLKSDIAEDVGLSEVNVIAPAVHDTASAAGAVPTEEEAGWAFISSGTWSIVGLELDKPIINDKSFEMNISNSGGAMNKTLYLKNVMGLWIIQCCKKIWNKKYPNLGYPEIEKMATTAKAFTAFIDPDHPMFLNPRDAVEQIVDYCQQTGQEAVDKNDIGTVSRIVFESLALKYRYVLENIMDATDKRISILHITGGGCKNHLLNTFTSNAAAVKLTAGPVEATAIGNIMMQAIGAGVYASLKDVRRVIKNSFDVTEYFPDNTEKWNSIYYKFYNTIKKGLTSNESGNK